MSKSVWVCHADDELFDLLKELSDLTGVAASTFVVQWLQLGKPQLVGLIKTFRVAKDSPVQALEELQEMVAQSLQLGSTAQVEMINEKKQLKKKTLSRKTKKKTEDM